MGGDLTTVLMASIFEGMAPVIEAAKSPQGAFALVLCLVGVIAVGIKNAWMRFAICILLLGLGAVLLTTQIDKNVARQFGDTVMIPAGDRRTIGERGSASGSRKPLWVKNEGDHAVEVFRNNTSIGTIGPDEHVRVQPGKIEIKGGGGESKVAYRVLSEGHAVLPAGGGPGGGGGPGPGGGGGGPGPRPDRP